MIFCTGRMTGQRGAQRRAPVAEVELAFLVGGYEAEEPGHLVTHAVLVDQDLSQRHVATAFAVDLLCLSVVAKCCTEICGGGELARVQFRVASGEPDEICVRIGRFIGQR